MTLLPVRNELVVPAGPATAFSVFTAQIGRWWPLAAKSVHHDGSVAFAGGRIVEFSASGREAVWGSVVAWEPDARVGFTWHPGRDVAGQNAIEVRFAAEGERTRVVLVHEGWEAFAEPERARREYEEGWPGVLAGYAAAVAAHVRDPGDTWVALVHTPSAGVSGSVYGDPRFREHAAFIDRMAALGYLIAAGPLDDSVGDGQTILRLRGLGRIEEARRLAEGDGSVAGGLFDVRVRPWRVLRSGLD
ncbi:MAG TPA: SRPBCC domain-containing protein [Microbacteriaceae bacterium]|nr:SRPBCC domain-containing protein [Microbacteriaceae bacterium]